MSFIGGRQVEFGCASVPPITPQKKNVKGFETVVDVFSEALMKRMCHDYDSSEKDRKKYPFIQKGIDEKRKLFVNCIEHTISFLRHIHALKIDNLNLNRIILWKEGHKMPPFYEGITVSLQSMLIEYHYPRMAMAMHKGATYGHYGLTQVNEAVLYIMEFFWIEKLLENVDVVIKTKEVEEWVNDHINYLKKNKGRLDKEEKARDEYQRKEMIQLNKSMARLKMVLK